MKLEIAGAGREALSSHRVDAAGFSRLFHERHRGREVQVFELLEVDATAAGLHLAELRGILLDEVAAFAADPAVQA